MLIPCAPSARHRYARLVAPDPREVDDELLSALEQLTERMNLPIGFNMNGPIPAGYTYFGQFADHDLTLDLTPLEDAGKKLPCDTENHRVPWLDLDHLYGAGPGSAGDRRLYNEDGVSFRLGEASLPGGRSFDVPLDEKDLPMLAEARNNENLIVRQVHAMFLKLHNQAVRELPPAMPARERFEAARARVRRQYQWLVRYDYLPRVCDPGVYARVVEKGEHLIDFETHVFSIPVEFSLAAFRFGHSMVRRVYALNKDLPPPGSKNLTAEVGLDVIFTEPHWPGALKPERRVDWVRFLAPGGFQQREKAMNIDTHIVEPLFHLPPQAVGSFVRTLRLTETNALPLRTLRRGALSRLATGEAVAAAFGRSPLRTDFPDPGPWQHLDDCGLKDRTPLWYYVLLEAQLEANGRTLGTVGSSIVASVIEGALRDDPDSFLNHPEADPTLAPWQSPEGESITIRTLLDVARVVGLA